ncbi:hypothetical protein ACFZAT_16235 [Streptomyces sp. NPDC008163]|uniref:hypothetical protein n=1 Tax=Streptomyces sp. NPDC008163 TaxID=3364818 RepID=UPI0036E18458
MTDDERQDDRPPVCALAHIEEHGSFSDEELAEARAKIFGSTVASKGADTA